MFDWFDSKQEVTVHDTQSYIVIIVLIISCIGVAIYFLINYHKKDLDVRVRRNIQQMNNRV